jgi:pyrimidine oxygenase
MKIGLFMPTVNNGFIMSEAAPQYKPDFDYNKEVVLKAERYGMEFALSLVKYRGFGGKTDHWHWALDSFTTIAGLAAVTEKIKLIGSVGLQAHHPAVAARHAAMIQMISEGRFWLNIVTGWQKSEYASLGLWRGDEHYASRYDYADEFITVCKELWETGESDFKGKYFQLDHARLAPQPREPITVVCAASSPRGMQFTAEHGDYNFIFGTNVEALRETNKLIRAAGQKAGREIKSIASIHCVMGDTDEEAERKVQAYYDGADLEALAHMSGQAEFDEAGTTSQIIQNLRIATFMGAEVLRGTPDTVAEKLDAYRDVEGLEGLMVCLDDPIREIDRFGEQVLPQLGIGAPVTT